MSKYLKSLHLFEALLCSAKPNPLWRTLHTSVSSLQQIKLTDDNIDSFLSSSSVAYLEDIYQDWVNNSSLVDKSWDTYFKMRSQDTLSLDTYDQIPARLLVPVSDQFKSKLDSTCSPDERLIEDHLKLYALIRSFQMKGHRKASLDPLGRSLDVTNERIMDLFPQFYHFSEDDLCREFRLPATTFIGGEQQKLTLREILSRLNRVYSKTIGLEYMFINSTEKCNWIRQNFETPGAGVLTVCEKKRVLLNLIKATRFEEFLAKKYSSDKRFGLEGCEMLIPAIKAIIDAVSARGVDHIVMGLAHRGRLNCLVNVSEKPIEEIFNEFSSKYIPTDKMSGDVKYHMGINNEITSEATNKKVKIVILDNPSHLEAVNPLVLGQAKAEQFYRDDATGDKVMGLLVHGDAAFAGQGVVYETINLSNLYGYTTHGKIHIVVNNQVGFTTDPKSARSSPYCTDVARVVNAPVFHVNVDDPEAVIHVCKVAAEWRSRYKEDVVIDLVCYRKNGHNEIDEPMFTHPAMYKTIQKQTQVLRKYTEKLLLERVIDQAWYDNESSNYESLLQEKFSSVESYQINREPKLTEFWKEFQIKQINPHSDRSCVETGLSEATLLKIGTKFCEIPSKNFEVYSSLKRILETRAKLITNRTADWAIGEALAFGSLLIEGTHVRLSGQDVERGTFSHRHHVIHDQSQDSDKHIPLNKIAPNQAQYAVCNSSLSEYAVLGFELGYSMINPNSLVMWEAQFGDFSNTAQPIIDQFIVSGQAKWNRQSGLVMLLPHGFEGMGPEHSSARLERFLQLSDDDYDHIPSVEDENMLLLQLQDTNIIVAYPSTPANYMHLLRRQVKMPFRKPLIVMTPKALLRLPAAQSSFDEMLPGTSFYRAYKETGMASLNFKNVKKIIFCSGKIYYDLIKEREKRNLCDQIAIVRIEQLAPFPYDIIKEELVKYKYARVCYAQEEHKNAGAFEYVSIRLQKLLALMKDMRALHIGYAGRSTAASTSTGFKHKHLLELKILLEKSMDI